jgi:hypothetical protein
MKAMRYLFASVLFAIVCVASPAHASTNTSEITDMWWIPSESGWGLNIILQNNIAFATFFVYDVNRNPVWYTAQLSYQGNFVWTGGLYATSGPWFGGPFPPTATIRQAGTASFSAGATLNQGQLTYSVDGVMVSKSVQRQTWTNENYTGTYAGGYSIRMTGCSPASLNGIQEVSGALVVDQTGSSVSMSAVTTGASCTFTGTYSQTGKLGEVQGTYSCTDSSHGTFDAIEMTPTVSGFTARISGQNQFCNWSGYFGGIARAK